jgi:hypothetical protein
MPKANNCPAGTVYSYDANGVPGCNALPDALSRAIFTLTCPPGQVGSFGSDGNQDCIAGCKAPNTLAYNSTPGQSMYNPTGFTFCNDASGNIVPGSSTEYNVPGFGPPQGGGIDILPLTGPGPTLNPNITPLPVVTAPVTASAVNTLIADLTSTSPTTLLIIGVAAYFLLFKK